MTLAYRVLDNFRHLLDGISPSEVDVSAPSRFEEWFDNDTEPGDSTGSSRRYRLAWLGSGKDGPPFDGHSRTADHDILLEVFYSSRYPGDELSRIVMRDRHDIAKALNVGSPGVDSRLGYSGSPSADIGLELRTRIEDRLERKGHLYYMRQLWRCQIRETEE
jgi:hypothetical protein